MTALAFAQNIRFPLKARGNDGLFYTHYPSRHPRVILSGIHINARHYEECSLRRSNPENFSLTHYSGLLLCARNDSLVCRHPRVILSGIHVSKGTTQ